MIFINSGDRSQLAKALVRAARVPHAVIGQFDHERCEVLEADVASAACSDAAACEDAVREAQATMSRAVGLHGVPPQHAGECDFAIEEPDAAPIIWLSSERCLVGLWHRRADATPFVALIRRRSVHAFPRWQRDVARIGLVSMSEQISRTQAVGPSATRSFVGEIIRHVSVGLALVDCQRNVIYANAAVDHWLGQQRILRITDRRLTARVSAAQKQLCAAIGASAGEAHQPRLLVFKCEESGGPAQVLTCLPLAEMPGRALIIFAQKRRDAAYADLLLGALGLTGAERRLAGHLLLGRTLEEAARETNIKISTARSYLKAIFAKTGVRRQSELVAVIGGLIPPVDGLRGGSARA